MKKEDNVLQEIKALSLGPNWSEKSYTNHAEPAHEKLTQYIAKRKPIDIKGIDISLKPETEVMDRLIQSMKSSCITYRFFPIVNFFLQKEQYKIVLSAIKNNTIFCTVVDKLPFLKKETAEDYLSEKYWDDFFYSETVSVSAPKGAFHSVNRCGITGILLGPPNYHLYSDLLREHYEQYLKNQYSWETFLLRIKNESSPEIVQQWINAISQSYRYHLKQNPEIIFENRTLAKQYLLQNISFVNDDIQRIKHIIFSREDINKITDEDLKQAILYEITNEMRVPIKIGYLCSARFRHSGFHVYKKGRDADKITYVCAIKRRIRDEYTSFSKKLENIIECIEKHPRESLENLAKYYFNIDSKPSNVINITETNYFLEFKRNLIFLIQQGWVTQYEDGNLYVSPRQTLASKNNQKYA